MKKLISAICFTSIAGCVSTQNSAFIGATPGCKSGQTVVNQKTVNTRFCIKKIMFQPSQYLVTVNEQPVFEGTDYTRVSFEKSTHDGIVNGACDGVIEILDKDTLKPIKTERLPSELVSGCNIRTDSTGNSLPFKKDVKCDKIYYKSLSPMLGLVVSLQEIARQCSVTLDNYQIFEGEFNF